MNNNCAGLSIFHYDSPLGRMTGTVEGEYLTGLWFDGQRHYPPQLENETGGDNTAPASRTISSVKHWLDLYFSGRDPGFVPPTKAEGTAFRQSVWKILTTIPYGQTMTYGHIAAELSRQEGGKKQSARAVGGAVGHNPISLIVPCHRVIGSDGSLTGYAGGLDKKVALLELEGILCDN